MLTMDGIGSVTNFREKRAEEVGWINGGFFVLEPEVIELVSDDSTIWEREPLEYLAKTGNLVSYKHTGFWQPMDTLREKRILDEMAISGTAPWTKN